MTDNYGRVGVLYGGSSGEREVSLLSGAGVHKALRSVGVDAHLFDTGTHSLADLAGAGFDRVFIALHGRHGEDGTLQGALELLQLPYTGSGTLASALAMDKIMTKRIWEHHGLPTPRFSVLRDESDLDPAIAHLSLPLIVKPPHEGSTLGVTRIHERRQLLEGFRLAARYDAEVLAEQFIVGRELTVALIGTGADARALPVIEIIAPEGNYDYEHKYLSDATQYVCPAGLSGELTQYIQDISLRAYLTLGCQGWGRADVMLDAEGKPWLLEINTSPGMTSHSLVPMAAKADGMDYAQLCLAILDQASCKVRTIAQADAGG